MQPVMIGGRSFAPLGLGCWVFERELWSQEGQNILMETMGAALQHGMNHFDTAAGYGAGASEEVVGRFLPGLRERIFLATKSDVAQTAGEMVERVRSSLARMAVDSVDLYYIHWPKSGLDMRPAMEGLETARRDGLIGAIGVSNFSPEQMEQISKAGRIDAYQLGYNVLWRFREQDVMAFCRDRGIPIITYGSIAQGILTGKFPRSLDLPAGDQRNNIIFFREANWPVVWEAVEALKQIAAQANRPLLHLAICWVLAQPGVVCALVGARSARQVAENAAALDGDIPTGLLERMTAVSDDLMRRLPDQGNMYSYYP